MNYFLFLLSLLLTHQAFSSSAHSALNQEYRFNENTYNNNNENIANEEGASSWRPLDSSHKIKCKYIFIDKSIYQANNGVFNILTNQLLSKLLQTRVAGRLELNHAHFKFYSDENCLGTDQQTAEQIDQLNDNNFALFGLDLSGNGLNDTLLEHILNKNPVLKYNINMIKYLNLSSNNLTRLVSSSKFDHVHSKPQPSELAEELNYLNEFHLKPDETFYLLNRFFNLEVLVMDRNPLLTFNLKNALQIFQRLRVMSLNQCSLGEKYAEQEISINNRPVDLFYLGLVDNQLDEHKINEYFSSTNNQTLTIDLLDLSVNRIVAFEEILNANWLHRIGRLNLEKNFIQIFNINNLGSSVLISDINLKFNLIKNTSIENFKLTSTEKVS